MVGTPSARPFVAIAERRGPSNNSNSSLSPSRLMRSVAASEPWSTASATISLTRSSARSASSGSIRQSTANVETIDRA